MLQRFVDQAAVEAEIAHVTVPWTVPAAAPVNGIVHVPAHNTPMKLGHREVLLIAIAKARKSIKDVERGQSFAEIARREERPNGMCAIWHRSSSCRRGSSPPLSTALLRPGSPRRLMAGVAALLILLTMTSVVLGSRRTFQGRATLRIPRLRIC